MERAVRLIVNPAAGAGRAARLLPGVEAALRSHGIAFRVDRTQSIDHARALAREARAAGEVAAAMGGDGLAGAVAGELVAGAPPRGTDPGLVAGAPAGGTDPGPAGRGSLALGSVPRVGSAEPVMAVIPGGRGNDLARKLGIGHDPVAAVDVLAAGRERRIDVGEAGGRVYVGILSAGIDSDVQVIANATRLPLGTLVYAYGAVRALRAWRPAGWTVTIDGTTHRFVGYSVAVANSGVFGGGMWLAPDAALDDGELDVVLLPHRPRRRYLLALPKVFKGTHVREPGFTVLRGREVTLAADRPFTAYADGDPIAELPATVRVRPAALRVLAP